MTAGIKPTGTSFSSVALTLGAGVSAVAVAAYGGKWALITSVALGALGILALSWYLCKNYFEGAVRKDPPNADAASRLASSHLSQSGPPSSDGQNGQQISRLQAKRPPPLSVAATRRAPGDADVFYTPSPVSGEERFYSPLPFDENEVLDPCEQADRAISKAVACFVENGVGDDQPSLQQIEEAATRLSQVRSFYPSVDILSRVNRLAHGKRTVIQDQILERPLFWEALRVFLRKESTPVFSFLETSQQEAFSILGNRDYDKGIDKLLLALEKYPFENLSDPQELDVIKKPLAALIEFFATTWTASFFLDATREKLRNLEEQLVKTNAKPMKILHQLQRFYRENGEERRHLELIFRPSMIWSPGSALRKKTALTFLTTSIKAAEVYCKFSLSKMCRLLGEERYRDFYLEIKQIITSLR